jgi:tripartite-type tricarboxylate transporter receptor subunit TctC
MIQKVIEGLSVNRGLVRKEIDISAIAFTSVMPQIEAGKVHVLASTDRLKTDPQIPTVAELGYTEIAREFWNGVLVPAATPQPIVNKLIPVFKKIITSPR